MSTIGDSLDVVICRLESVIASPACYTMNAHMTELLAQAVAHLRAMLDIRIVGPTAIPMLLTCPSCGERHIDEGEFATKVGEEDALAWLAHFSEYGLFRRLSSTDTGKGQGKPVVR